MKKKIFSNAMALLFAFTVISLEFLSKGTTILECSVDTCDSEIESGDQSCYCDESCQVNGDCCDNVCNECGYACNSTSTNFPTINGNLTCEYRCGVSQICISSSLCCGCDSICSFAGDCCSDHSYFCTNTTLAPVLDSFNASCAGSCGDAICDSLDDCCYCDTSCILNGDCCDDYVDLCYNATSLPTSSPTLTPTLQPSVPLSTTVPTAGPTKDLTFAPSVAPTSSPSERPTPTPSGLPTAIPTPLPTLTPTIMPTTLLTATPTDLPTIIIAITGSPTVSTTPTEIKTSPPVSELTFSPTAVPTAPATSTMTESTSKAMSTPTEFQTSPPTSAPTISPTAMPTAPPTSTIPESNSKATSTPTELQTSPPTSAATVSPTAMPTLPPTSTITESTSKATSAPTELQNSPPTSAPTISPTAVPTVPPTSTIIESTSKATSTPTELQNSPPTSAATVSPTSKAMMTTVMATLEASAAPSLTPAPSVLSTTLSPTISVDLSYTVTYQILVKGVDESSFDDEMRNSFISVTAILLNVESWQISITITAYSSEISIGGGLRERGMSTSIGLYIDVEIIQIEDAEIASEVSEDLGAIIEDDSYLTSLQAEGLPLSELSETVSPVITSVTITGTIFPTSQSSPIWPQVGTETTEEEPQIVSATTIGAFIAIVLVLVVMGFLIYRTVKKRRNEQQEGRPTVTDQSQERPLRNMLGIFSRRPASASTSVAHEQYGHVNMDESRQELEEEMPLASNRSRASSTEDSTDDIVSGIIKRSSFPECDPSNTSDIAFDIMGAPKESFADLTPATNSDGVLNEDKLGEKKSSTIQTKVNKQVAPKTTEPLKKGGQEKRGGRLTQLLRKVSVKDPEESPDHDSASSITRRRSSASDHSGMGTPEENAEMGAPKKDTPYI